MLEYPNRCKDNASSRKKQTYDKEISSSDTIRVSSFYESSNIQIEYVELNDRVYHLYGRSSLGYGVCPYCGTVSHRIHSKYYRTVTDLSIVGSGVVIHFQARKFFCEGQSCQYKTFAEQPGNEIFRYRRRTRRCEVLVAQQSSVCSSNTAKKLLSAMNVPLSSSTIIRDLHRITVPDVPSVRRIGVDDWAYRKGVSYGSIIVNLEKGSFLALLGDRDHDSFKDWLDRHACVDTVSRDRSTEYSAAISSTHRDIMEVADRFHLVKNLSDKMTRIVNEHYAEYKALARPEEARIVETDKKAGKLLLPVSGKEDKRKVYFDEVKRLRATGLSIKRISENVGISIPTVIKYIHMEELPMRSHTARNPYHLYEERVTREYLEDGKSLQVIWMELVSEGVRFGNTPFYEHFKYLTAIKRKTNDGRFAEEKELKKKQLVAETKTPLLPPLAISMIMDKYIRGKDLKDSENDLVKIMNKLPWFCEICTAASEFYKIIKETESGKLKSWMLKYERSSISYLKSFVYGLRNDMTAIENALKCPISNGILEGHVNKLKSIKRVMYGRAGIKMLGIKMYLAEDVFFN